MDGLPIWRPTTAAWDVIPPVAVRMPCDTNMPRMSSGTVSRRTSTTALPASDQRTASSALNTTCPLAAPGEAASPLRRHRNRIPLLLIEPWRQELRE